VSKVNPKDLLEGYIVQFLSFVDNGLSLNITINLPFCGVVKINATIPLLS
jgi:hypothetical protein